MMTPNQLPKTFFISLGLIAQVVALPPTASAQYPYAVTAIQAPSNIQSPTTGALCDVNASGKIAGAGMVGNGFSLYTGTSSGLNVLPLPSGWATSSVATPVGMNDLGQVVGSGLNAAGVGQPYLATPNGSTPIPVPAGWQQAAGVAVNNSGEVTGYGFNGGAGALAFTGSASASTAFALTAGAVQQATYAINAAGQTAGVYYTPAPANSLIPFINWAFVGTTANIALVTLPQPNQSVATGINDSNQVAGWLQLAPNYVPQAFFSTSAGLTQIPLPSNSVGINLFGNLVSSNCGSTDAQRSGHFLNNTGFVIGNASTLQGSDPSSSANNEAWVWDANDGTRLLTSLVPPPWTVTNAISISNSGMILAYGSCTGANCPSSGNYSGYILLLPQGGACDVGGEITVGIGDVQSIINQAIGTSPPLNDLNQDGVVNVTDVQIVMNAALGKACTT
jgi:hypothetical protein